jgi:hypothetical protein
MVFVRLSLVMCLVALIDVLHAVTDVGPEPASGPGLKTLNTQSTQRTREDLCERGALGSGEFGASWVFALKTSRA